MLEPMTLPLAAIRVPVKRAKTLDGAKAEALAEDMLENGQKVPIQCRKDPKAEGAYILVEGLHRLEAARALGEETIKAYLVQVRLR